MRLLLLFVHRLVPLLLIIEERDQDILTTSKLEYHGTDWLAVRPHKRFLIQPVLIRYAVRFVPIMNRMEEIDIILHQR